MTAVRRYHAVLVTLHWLLAVMITASLIVGFTQLFMSNTDPRKLKVLLVHMAGGMVILALMTVRLIVRWRTTRPAPATTGRAFADRLAPLSHHAFYGLVVLMVATGYGIAIPAGLPAIVFAGSGSPLPETFTAFPAFFAHLVLAVLMSALILLHAAAAIWHQLVVKDRVMSRMGYGRRHVG